jgi:hypothetical protein
MVERLLGALEDPAQRKSVAGAAASALENDRRTLGAFARDVLKVREEEVMELIAERVLGFLTRPETARDLSHRLLGLIAPPGMEPGSSTVRQALRFDAGREADLERALGTAVPSLADKMLPTAERALAGGTGTGRLMGLLGAAAGLGAGLVLVALKALGVVP